MKSIKKDLKKYLEQYGRDGNLVEIYNAFPYAGHDLTNRQKGDRVRSVWRKIQRKRLRELQYFENHRLTVVGGHLKNRLGDKVITAENIEDVGFTPIDSFEVIPPNTECGKQVTSKQMGVSIDHTCPFPASNLTKLKYPKILVFDLETSPLKSYVWSLWKQNVNPTNGQLQSQRMILSWSAKWLYQEEVMNDSMLPEEVFAENDSRVTKSLWELINEADILIAHNGNGFDVKIMNTRFLLHGLPPPEHYQTIDTLLHARKRFRLESNKLDYLGKILGLGEKQDTGGFKLWVDCMNGSTEAMEKMVNYCDQDVRLLEAVYLKMRPWIMPHPNLNLIVNDSENVRCPSCNSPSITDHGTYTTYANVYPAHKCMSCQSTFRSRKAVKMDKTNLTIPTPN